MRALRRSSSAVVAALSTVACISHAPPPTLPVETVGPGIYVHFGVQEEAAPANLGAIANVGFIVGSRCVAVIDTGGSRAEGELLKAAIAKATRVPICYVINTHMHPDHVFGNAAFAPDGNSSLPEFIGSARLPIALASRSHAYELGLQHELGEAGDGSTVILPTRTVDKTLELDLGDRQIELRTWPTAHTDNDLTVLDRQSGVLFSGDLLFVERIPVIDGSINGWLKVDDELAALPGIQRIVPGHGPVPGDWHAALGEQQRYLNAVRDGIRAAIKAKQTLGPATASVGTEERTHWLLFERYHARNVTAAYVELEWEE